MPKTKILITGHLGFVGSHLTELLLKDYELFGYDLIDGDDIRDEFKLDRYFSDNKFDVVIHLAARAGVRTGEEYPNEFITTNIIGTQNIVNACKKHNVRQLISFSSSSVLGGNKTNKGLNEDDEYNPKSLYAITKVAGEYIVKNSGIPYIVIRPFTLYGENGRKDMVIYKWINQIKSGNPISVFGNKESQRGYTYIKDLCIGVRKCILNHEAMNNIIHLGGSEIITLERLIGVFSSYCDKNNIELFCKEEVMPSADVMSSFSDNKKAFNLLDWIPSNNFDDNLTNILTKELYGRSS
jgi:UDP-glucuronate 4-epimerase